MFFVFPRGLHEVTTPSLANVLRKEVAAPRWRWDGLSGALQESKNTFISGV